MKTNEYLTQIIPATRQCDIVYKDKETKKYFRIPVVCYGLFHVHGEDGCFEEVRPMTQEGDGPVNDLGPGADNFVGYEFDGKLEW